MLMLKQILLYLPAQVLGPLCQFAAAVFWTHYLAPSDYGILAYILAAQDLTLLLSIQWWSLYTMRFFRRLQLAGQLDDYRQTDLAIVLGSTVIQIVAAVVILSWMSECTPSLVSATSIFFITRVVLSHYGERARAMERIGVYTIAQMSSSVVGSLVTFPVLLFVSTRPEALVWSLAVPQAVALALVVYLLDVPTRLLRVDRELVLSGLRYAFPLLLSGLFMWLCVNGIRFAVEWKSGLAAVGLISVGWGLGNRLASVVAMLGVIAAFPRAVLHFEKGDAEAALAQVSAGGVVLFALMAPTVVGSCLIASSLVEVFIAQEFRAVTALVLPFAVFTAGVRAMRLHFLDQVQLLRERTMTTLAINCIDVVSTTIGCLIGVVGWDVYGAVLGAALGSILPVGFSAFFAVKMKLQLPILYMLRICLATAIMAGGILLLPPLSGIKGLLIVVPMGAAIYIFASAILFLSEIRSLLSQRRSAALASGGQG